jgi:hypothetical protein
MAKPFIEERGLRLVEFQRHHIEPFVRDLSPENLREFESLYGISPTEALEGVVGQPLIFTVEKEERPVAVTGLVLHSDHALMWSLFSKELRKSWISFARASRKLIEFYHTLHPELRSEVWTENEMIHQWLLHLGFLPQDAIELPNGHTVVRFVRCSHESKSVQTALSRPVLH